MLQDYMHAHMYAVFLTISFGIVSNSDRYQDASFHWQKRNTDAQSSASSPPEVR